MKQFSLFFHGKPLSVKALNTVTRSNVQTGYQGYTLESPTESKLEDIFKVYMAGDTVQVHVTLF